MNYHSAILDFAVPRDVQAEEFAEVLAELVPRVGRSAALMAWWSREPLLLGGGIVTWR